MIPAHYVPRHLTEKDKKKQKQHLRYTRKMYQKGKYINRPRLRSYKNRASSHVEKAKEMYKIDSIVPSKKLAQKTKCSVKALRKIAKKGRGAYYSSGSRPNQTAQSWARARLASALTGGNASIVDMSILEEGCQKNSKPLRLAKTAKKRKMKGGG